MFKPFLPVFIVVWSFTSFLSISRVLFSLGLHISYVTRSTKVLKYLISSQDFEGGHDLVGSVCVRCLARHEVDEGLEGDDAHSVGVNYAHDARELVFTLEARERNCQRIY